MEEIAALGDPLAHTEGGMIGGSKTTSPTADRYKVDLDRVIEFIFPKELQHPLAAGRLFAFALCGPLDGKNQIRTGFKGSRVVMDYELEQMCGQFEREDIIQVYLHNPKQMGLLTSKEQEAIIGQADGHLKRAKGKAMLPVITKSDIQSMFRSLPRDENGKLSFHDMQNAVLAYRAERVKQFKLVYPNLSSEENSSSQPLLGTMPTDKKKKKRLTKVSTAVAPTSLFIKNKGETNSDVVQTTTLYLTKYAYQITDIDQGGSVDMVSNVRLLREIEPRPHDPYGTKGRPVKWNDSALFTGSAIGSKVNCTPSSSTWKQSITKY